MEISTAIGWIIAVSVWAYVIGNKLGYNEGREFGYSLGRLDKLIEQNEKRQTEETEWWQRGDPPPWEAE